MPANGNGNRVCESWLNESVDSPMRVSVELPDPPRLEPLLESLSKQYQDVLDQLLQLQREDRVTPILQAVQAQTDGLVQAFQHMMGMMHNGRQQDHQQMQDMMR